MKTMQTKFKWFWPWQDDKEEAWLEQMSASGANLHSVGLMGIYTFDKGEPRTYTYRLDYMRLDKNKRADYLQIFQDAGWEYIGEMSNWQYWRKPVADGERAEIFTDNQSKIQKYRRILVFMGFFLLLLMFLGANMFFNTSDITSVSSAIELIYFIGQLLYAIIIPIYIVVVVKLALRINKLKKTAL
ncbi:MAG: hypothetical protein H6Q37_1414 [Chloroflexi bacterium]|nr:hypothetical protein [Chloroflexota bacterium]